MNARASRASRARSARRGATVGATISAGPSRSRATRSLSCDGRRKAAAAATTGCYDWRAIDKHAVTRGDADVRDHDRRKPAEALMARRAEQAVAAVAAFRRRACGRQGRRHAARAEGTGGCRHRHRHRRRESRQHFVHGFLEFVDGIDFAHKVEMGIRADRYKAMVPQVVGELAPEGPRARDRGAARPRAHEEASSRSPCRGR